MIGWILVVSWFALGMWFAPRAAALAYRYTPMQYEENKILAAKTVYWLCLFLGPVYIVWFAFRVYLLGPLHDSAESRLERALIKHDEGYRNRRAEEQERRIKQLEHENARLTRQVLDS